MTVAQRFRAAWVDTNVPVPAGVELLPVRLARACVQVLPVDGASISVLTEDFRYPLGASDDTANAAERLQFTQGEGPCLDALRTNSPVQANAQDIYRRWPLLYGELTERTSYRSVVSMPLRVTPVTVGALDLYLEPPTQAEDVDLSDAAVVADEVIAALTVTLHTTAAAPDLPGPAWLHGPTAEHRICVWVAMGRLNVALGLAAPDGLALLRAYAYAHGRLLDEVADAVVNETLPTEQLQNTHGGEGTC